MNHTWRNEWHAYRRLRAAGRWIVWIGVMYVGVHVIATVVQRVTQ